MSNLKQGESLYLKSPYLKFGLSWDILGEETIDLDASCVVFNDFGKIMDAVYFNQTEIMNKAITHSGDNTTGEGDGDDEVIMIDLTKVSQKVKALVILITCYKKGNFSNVETATATLKDSQTDQTIVNISLGCQGKHTGLIMATIYKDDQDIWYVKNIRQNCNARDFIQAELDMKEQLYFLIPKELMNELKWDPKQEKSFNLKKNDVVSITANTFILGLGWDTRCDLDANCTLISFDTNTVENVYFRNKQDNVQSVIHSGDNTTGEGEGDDEKIFIHLEKVPEKYSTLIFSICVYTSNMSFHDVKGAYVRMLDEKGKEMLKYQLGDNYSQNAMIMCKIERTDEKSGWKFKAIGEGTTGRVVTEIQPFLKMFHFKKALEKEKINAEERSKLLKVMDDYRTQLKNLQKEIQSCQKVIKYKENEYHFKCFAKNLEKKSFFGNNDPYFIIEWNGKRIFTSETRKFTLNPKWDEFQMVRDEKESSEKITFKFYDHHVLSEPTFIGKFETTFDEMITKDTFNIFNEYHSKKNTYTSSGTFHVQVTVKKIERDVKNQKYFDLENNISNIDTKIKEIDQKIKDLY